MPANELSSKVSIIETPPAVRQITGAATAVFGFVGITERGPIGEPVLLTSFADYKTHFGGFLSLSTAHVAQAVQAFFENGTGQLWVVRTAHYTDVIDPATITAVRATNDLLTPGDASPAEVIGGSAPFNVAHASTIVFSVDGGGDSTATFNGVAEQQQSAGAFPLNLDDGWTLLITIDSGAQQTVTFLSANPLIADINAVSAEEAAAVIGQQLTSAHVWTDGDDVFIESETKGTASAVIVGGGTAAATFAFAQSVAGSGNVARLSAVTAAEVETLVEAANAGVVVDEFEGDIRIRTIDLGAAATLQIKVATANAFGFTEGVLEAGENAANEPVYTVEGKTHGTYANGIVVATSAATSGEAGRFNLTVTVDGVVKESYSNLSPLSTDTRYAVDFVNGASNLIRLTDLELDGSPRPNNQSITLADGEDGLVGLADADFIGGRSVDGATGLRALDLVLDLAVVAIPGRASSTIANGLLSYCEVTRAGEVFAVIDVPSGLNRTQVVTWVESTAAILGVSEYGAVYWPWVKVANPDKATFGNDPTITVAPSGSVCGVMARVDGSRAGGVYDPPAGSDGAGALLNVRGVADADVVREETRDFVYPKMINPITTSRGRGYYIDGSRTLKDDGNFPNINERRGINSIKRSVRDGLDFVRFKNHDEDLRAEVRRTLQAFMVLQMQRGAFRSQNPEDAFQVVCDATNNGVADVFGRRLNAKLLVATAKPTEFVTIELTQDTRGL